MQHFSVSCITPVINHIKYHAELDPASGLIADFRLRGMRALIYIVAGITGTSMMNTALWFFVRMVMTRGEGGENCFHFNEKTDILENIDTLRYQRR